MSHFTLRDNGLNYSLPLYGRMDTLCRIMSRNRDRFLEFFSQGNLVVDNRHPLVQLLLEVSVDVTWEPDYLFSIIDTKGRRALSSVGITSLYNNGKNFCEWFFPETNHNTLVVTSMDVKSSSLHNTNLVSNKISYDSLHPIMSNGNRHYWNLQHLIDTVKRTAPNQIFTILQLDIHEFIMNYYWYLKDRMERGISVGLSPHHYVTLVVANMWMEYNDVVTINCTVDNTKVESSGAPFAIEAYEEELWRYLLWRRRYLLGTPLKTFSQYTRIYRSIFDNKQISLPFFTNAGKSLLFIQMSWIWTLSTLHWVSGFLEISEFVGYEDPTIMSKLSMFRKLDTGFIVNECPDVNWKKFFLEILRDVKSY